MSTIGKIVELTYSKGQTVQVKSYEPVNVHFSVKAELAEGDSVQATYEMLKEVVNDQVQREIRNIELSKPPF